MVAAPNWLRRIVAVFNVSAAMTSTGVGGKHLPMKILMSRVVSLQTSHISMTCVSVFHMMAPIEFFTMSSNSNAMQFALVTGRPKPQCPLCSDA